MAVGMLCANDRTTAEYWLSELLDNESPIGAAEQQVLVRLFDETRRLLASDDFAFDLFLPDDDTALNHQVLALKNWCQGFLFGIGATHLVSGISKEVQEILKDISEFTKLDTDVEGEEDERAYTEITEYLRSAVLLLRDEFSVQSEDGTPGDGFETNRV